MWIVLSVLGILFWTAPAAAELKFCNHTPASTWVAVAYVQKDASGTSTGGDRGVTTEGWWRFEPGECASVTAIDHAGQHWIYYHAYSGSRRWDGGSLLCIPTGAPFISSGQFMRPGDGCVTGRRLMGFRRAETSARTHTINLQP